MSARLDGLKFEILLLVAITFSAHFNILQVQAKTLTSARPGVHGWLRVAQIGRVSMHRKGYAIYLDSAHNGGYARASNLADIHAT